MNRRGQRSNTTTRSCISTNDEASGSDAAKPSLTFNAMQANESDAHGQFSQQRWRNNALHYITLHICYDRILEY
ncbi:hypothetical protein GR157_18935 [Burkholderia sp. 4701]|nr:hypothetical protein [Burkholderia sp. 4701]MXN83740.1 hypothetical protein [Burkholderia sp. 4812]